MQNSLVSGDDMRYLVQQTPEALTTIMGQMTSLVQGITDLQNDTNERVETMEKQPWYKKMWMTITGKNKASKAEIQRNQDKIISYISEAVSQLYQLNCIDQQVMCSLGNRMNQVYAQVTEVYNEQLQMKEQIAEIMAVQQQTIQALGGFVTKLNEKIESVDNFHMLITEIQQGHYHDESQLYSLCCVLAQLDKRTLEDDRKLNILRDALTQSKIINEDSISIQQYLMDILTLADNKVGVVYLELCNFRNSFPANLFAEMIENYHFLPKMEKMSKKKETIIQKILDKYDLDASADFSMSDISESFLENKQNSLVNPAILQIQENSVSATVSSNVTTVVSNQNSSKLAEAEKLYMNAKFKQAFPIFEELANQGNGRAMYFVGEMYTQGEGVTQDTSKGEYWRNKGAAAGDPLAKLNTAYSYDTNSSMFSEIIDEVFPTILQLAEADDPIAQDELADIFFNYPKMEDEEKFLKWCKKSAEQGHFHSEYALGNKILWNSDDWRDADAAKWYRKAAEKGYARAQYWLGLCYENGVGGVAENDEESFQWYQRAAEQGEPDAQVKVGRFYQNGIGVPENDRKAVKWFRKAAEQEDGEAQNLLGVCYAGGYGVAQNDTEAVKWYIKSAENNDSMGQYNLARRYENGNGIEQNEREAFKWCERAAEQNNSDAQHQLGFYYWRGIGVSADPYKSKEWWDKAIENGDTESFYWLGLYYRDIEEDISEAIEWFEKSAEENDDEYALTRLGEIYRNGIGIKKNFARAYEYFKKAAKAGVADAQNFLGLMFDNGEHVQQNYHKAAEWYQKAVDQGHTAAKYNLAMCYYYGTGVGEDEDYAEYLLQEAADEGFEAARDFLEEHF